MTRLLPPLLFVLAAIAMLALHQALPGPHLAPVWLRSLGLVPLAAGLAIAWWHARLFRRIGTNLHTFREPGQLVTGGLFRISRNPMYLGFVLSLAGLGILLGAATPWAVVAAFVLVVDRWYIRFEEAAMQHHFGAAYEAYRRDVRRWL